METLTWLIEFGVGLACIVVGAMVTRGTRLRSVGVLLAFAGLAAVAHSLLRLSSS